MFHTGGLIVLCGLLAQTTALPPGLNIPGPPAIPLAQASGADLSSKALLGKLKDGLSNGLLSGGLQNKLTDGGLPDILLKGLTSAIPGLNDIIDLKVTNPQLLDIGFVQSDDGHRLYVHIPLSLRLNFKPAPLRNLLQVDMKMNITVELKPETNKDGKVHLVFGACTTSPVTVDISQPDGLGIAPLKDVYKAISDNLNKLIPSPLQNMVCPLVNNVLSKMDVTLAHAIAEKLLDGVKFQLEI